jgi:peptidoglycan/xylan/chitin deacetylase (PgdA/CDA1 family)
LNIDFLKRLPGRALWHTPRPFRTADVLARGYSLRCVLFHDVTDRASSFTKGLGVSMTRRAFDQTLRFLVRHYSPISLGDVLDGDRSGDSARPPVLITFDDAYASVATDAWPICLQYGVPALFLVNARFVGNRELSIDNLVCHVVNSEGYGAINRVAAEVVSAARPLRSLRETIGLIASLSLTARRAFYDALAHAAGLDTRAAAAQAQLYVSEAQLAQLAAAGCEIGNHTYSHVHGRILDDCELMQEIDWNRSVLESMTARRVRSFSVPYGSSIDLPPHLVRHLARRGYEAVFLGERRMNTAVAEPSRPLYRVSLQPGTDADLFTEIEVMPRLRALRGALWHPSAAAGS